MRRVPLRGVVRGETNLGGPGNLVFTGADDDPDTLKTLAKMGFSEPATVSNTVRTWHAGRYRAVRSTRAELLTELFRLWWMPFPHP